MTEDDKRTRPTGIIFMVIWLFAEGIFGLVIAGLMIRNSNVFKAELSSIVALFSILLAIISFIIMWGLWRLKNWARNLAILFAALALPKGIIGLLRGDECPTDIELHRQRGIVE